MKKIAKAIISMGVVLAFAGCSWQIPQTVAVKTNADYSFSLGNYSNDLNESMDTNSMLGDSTDSSRVAKYDYFPGKIDKNTQHYLLDLTVLDQPVLTPAAATTAFTSVSTDTYEGTTDLEITTMDNDSAIVGLDFNPTTILSEMAASMGDDLEGKIEFAAVPMYLYCVIPDHLEAKVQLKMFYGTEGDNPTPLTTEQQIINTNVVNRPKPSPYQMEEQTVITNFENTSYVEKKYITDFLNMQNIQEDSQLCIKYEISDVKVKQGFNVAAAKNNGVSIKIYAVVDLPLSFKVLQDVGMDVNKMSGGSEDATEASNDAVAEAGENEFSKYLNVMDSISIKYVIYQLPLYASAGMSLGVDLVGDGNFERGSDVVFVEKGTEITEEQKTTLVLKQTTIQRMKAASQINPNFKIFIKENTVYSIPRDKMIDMNLEISFTTDGTVQVK